MRETMRKRRTSRQRTRLKDEDEEATKGMRCKVEATQLQSRGRTEVMHMLAVLQETMDCVQPRKHDVFRV